MWMVPRWTFDTDKAATSFDIYIQEHNEPACKDLAAGAGGDFRYVYSNHDKRQTRKVSGAMLIRSSSGLSSADQEGMVSRCDVLYLVMRQVADMIAVGLAYHATSMPTDTVTGST